MTVRTTRAPGAAGRHTFHGDAGTGWRERLRHKPRLLRCYRGSVFVAGLVCVAAAAVLWTLSLLLALPPAFAGLWLWATEFAWGRRLFHGFRKRARLLWRRAKARPRRWGALTVGGLLTGAGASWAVVEFGLLNSVTAAVGL